MLNNTWFTSDNHFSHDRIRYYASRPYTDVREMDEDMINRWNEVVSPGDTVFHLGDFAFGPIDHQRRIFDKLNGRKHLVLGNHDGNKTRMHRIGFEVAEKRLECEFDGRRICMVHKPSSAAFDWVGRDILLYGHLHDKKVEMYDKMKSWVNCCVENWDYRPIALSQIFATVDGRLAEE